MKEKFKIGDNYKIEYLSELTSEEAIGMLNLKIIKIDAREYSIRLYLENGNVLIVRGSGWEGSSLGVECIDEKDDHE